VAFFIKTGSIFRPKKWGKTALYNEETQKENTMFKFYRGTTIREANELALDKQTRDLTHWTDSFDNAAKYSKGAVVEIEMDELPPHFNLYRGVCQGDAIHGTFAEWVLPRDYFENRASCFVELATVHIV
jgi:hypothetical protein